MNLITINKSNINNQEIQTVNARELHEFLEVKSKFADWIKNRIGEYGFSENSDYITISKNLESGGRSLEYHLSLNMAKELSMVERNEKGREARKYFIECEKIAKNKPAFQLPDFTNPTEAARAWADQFEEKQIAYQKLEEAQPKIEFVDKYVDSTDLKGFRQVCKILKANESKFREFLLEEKIMYRLNGSLVAYQNHVDAKRFDHKTGVAGNGHAFTRALFTAKGVEWVAGQWAKFNLRNAA